MGSSSADTGFAIANSEFYDMALVNLRNVNASYGGEPVLEDVNLQIELGERISLVGRNGSGKSTLLKLLTGQLAPEVGEVTRLVGLRVTNLTQEVPQDLHGSVYDTAPRAASLHHRRFFDAPGSLAPLLRPTWDSP